MFKKVYMLAALATIFNATAAEAASTTETTSLSPSRDRIDANLGTY